jgi:hypothetical protein
MRRITRKSWRNFAWGWARSSSPVALLGCLGFWRLYRFGGAAAFFGQQLQVERVTALFRGRINQGGDRGKVHHSRHGLAGAKTAVKIPEINAFGQGNAALAFDVFANLVFRGFQQSVCVFAFGFEWECFFQVCFQEGLPWR